MAGGGTLVRQVLRLGLLEQFELHIAPVVLGDGQRLLDPSVDLADDQGIELTPTRVVADPAVTHIRYSVGARTRWCSTTTASPATALLVTVRGFPDEVHAAHLRQRGELGRAAAQEFAEIVRRTDALNQELFASGELVGAYGVGDQPTAKMVRVDEASRP